MNFAQVPQPSASPKVLTVLDRAIAKLEASERAKNEPIAIISMSCRFPGGADTPEAYWQLLREGREGITEVPRDRWSIEEYYDPNPEMLGKMYTKYGGFLSQVDRFDAEFFGISPREAQSLDPQQRLLLEVSWETLENAGRILPRTVDNQTGVFIGVTTNDYARKIVDGGQLQNIDTYYITGNPLNAIAGRLAYTLGLQGPCLAVDTACSSSLVSVHLACQSLRHQECHQALAGGVNLILAPDNTVALSRARMMSPDGRCKTFDAGADGFVRGEGCGILLLKRLSDAVADGDRILALIKGSAVNQDGASSGFTAPSKKAQESLIRQALAQAKAKPAEIDYVETHGTGTSLGDPIEVRALAEVFGRERSTHSPLTIASVKTNIGHLESAAGIAGLMKVVLALQHQQIPPHLHLHEPNPHVNWQDLPLQIPTQLMPWRQGEKPRLAGVSSFGASGTNAHVVLAEAPESNALPNEVDRPLHILSLSAKSDRALQELASKYHAYLAHPPQVALSDVCFSANVGKGQFKHRASVVASDHAELVARLESLAQGEITDSVYVGVSKQKPKVAFLFTGQGSQYPGMGEQLYQTQPSFRAAFKQCAQLFDPELDPTLLSVLYGENTALLNQTLYTQPALFTLEYALAQLWLNWGINPSVVIGHSVGEYVAATIAGVFSLEDAVKLLAARARGIQALPEGGGLVALLASAAVTADLIAPYASQVSIAAYNAPNSTVISGANEALAAIIQQLEQRGLKHKRLSVSHAFHSPLMSPMLADFRRVAESISYHPPEIDFISNLTGELNPSGVTTPQYWVDHVSEAVNFVAGMKTLEQQSCQCFLEIGAQPTLLGLARRCLSSAEGFWLPSLRPTGGEWEQMLASVAQLFVAGVGVDWLAFEEESSRRRVSLPTYPFQRQRFWLDEAQLLDGKGSTNALPQSSLLRGLHTGDVDALVAQLNEYQLADAEKKLLPKLLKLLVQQHQEQLNQSALDDLLYQVKWQQSPSNPATVTGTENWVIFADRQGIGAALAQGLEALGHRCYQILAGTGYQQKDATTWQINPADADELEQLWQHLPNLQGVIHLWNLDSDATDVIDLDLLVQAQARGCASVLHTVQNLVKHQSSAKLWLATQGGVAIANSPVQPTQGMVWGLGKVIALEHPEIWGGAIDLDPAADTSSTIQAITQAIATTKEDRVAYRDGHRYVPRLVKTPAAATKLGLKSTVSYLIAGGLGSLGLRVARWMVELGARHLILTSRREPSSAARQEIAALEALGATVTVAQADVCHRSQLQTLLTQIPASLPLAGIIHAAGVLDDGILIQQNWQRCDRVMSPKVIGTWNLHCLTQELPLDFFVCFSSVASLLGSPGQGSYAAGNGFMDALAHYRHQLGLPALSINWGPWAQSGMAANLNGERQALLESRGMTFLDPELGLQSLERLLSENVPQVGVLKADWSVFKQKAGVERIKPLLSELIPDLPEAVAQSAPTGELLTKLQSAKQDEIKKLLSEAIQSEIARILKLKKLPDVKEKFFNLGLDSLMTIELINHLEKELGRRFSATLLFNYHNIQALVDYLAQEFSVSTTEMFNKVVGDRPQELREVDTQEWGDVEQLSEQELVELISKEYEISTN